MPLRNRLNWVLILEILDMGKDVVLGIVGYARILSIGCECGGKPRLLQQK